MATGPVGGEPHDLVVVGGGMGGLACAALSQRRGLRVALLEAHSKLGGCAGYFDRGPFTFDAKLETEAAPKTCAAFLKHMPFKSQVVHVRWSGEAVWIPLGDLDFGVTYENHTSYPAPGQIILYPGGISETEILLAYGGVHFASKMGQLAGNHFVTLTSGLENLAAFGKTVLWKGAQKIRFEEI